jgi:hypothetical protein
MQLVLTEKQLERLSQQLIAAQDVNEEENDPAAAAPDAGTSSDGEKKTGATKWESGVTRGPGNQIGVTKWSDTVGSSLKRGKANPLSEQSTKVFDFKTPYYPKASSDYFANVDSQNRRNIEAKISGKTTQRVYKADDGENLVINLIKGEYEEALLDLRSVIMTPGGMATQTVIEVVFSETIVVPVVVEAINAAIILNDLDLYVRQGSKDPEAAFRVLEDILMYITRGTFKLVGKGLKTWLKSPAGINYMRSITANASKYIASIKSSIAKLPNSGLKKYILGKINNLDSGIVNILSNFTGKIISKIPSRYRKGIIMGLLVYVSASGIDRLLNVKKGTTKNEMAKADGPSDEYMAKVEAVAKPTVTPEDIKTADDLNILAKKNELKKYAEEAATFYKAGYPCLINFYKKGQFIVVASTEEKDIFKINNKEYYDDGRGGIYETETQMELVC